MEGGWGVSEERGVRLKWHDWKEEKEYRRQEKGERGEEMTEHYSMEKE